MPQVKMEIVFDSIWEARQFFEQQEAALPPSGSAAIPTQEVGAVPTTIRSYSDREALTLPISMPSQSQTVTASLVPNPPQQEQDIASAVRGALDAMLQRLPSGTGAAKAHEILNKYGYKRTRDVADPAKAQSIIAEFKAA